MKKVRSIAFLLAFCAVGTLLAQSVTGVSTTPMNKVAIVEEFTGVRCFNCVYGHYHIAELEQENPNKLYYISMHPSISSYTEPFPGDEDLSRTYPSAFFSSSFCGASCFMPSAFFNRRVWDNERIQSTSKWETRVDEIISEPSPLNVGVLASYDSLTKMLDVTVEVYYTADVTASNFVYCVLTEDNITVQQQVGASGPYVQQRVFREAMSPQWGSFLISSRTAGTLSTMTYSFDNSARTYDMAECRVTAYVMNYHSRELYSGMQKHVVGDLAVTRVEPKEDLIEMDIKIVPNPFSEVATVRYHLSRKENVEFYIYDMNGKLLIKEFEGIQAPGDYQIKVDAISNGLAAGMYMVQLRAGTHTVTKNMVVN